MITSIVKDLARNIWFYHVYDVWVYRWPMHKCWNKCHARFESDKDKFCYY
jgi:hypothetical protein